MARYLQRYVGKYRVLAEYDRSTNDYPRIHGGSRDGELDDSFDDIYIACEKGSRICHVGGSKLQTHIPSVGRGHNILIAIYEDTIGNLDAVGRDYDAIYKALEDNGLIFDIEEYDTEILFKFKAPNIETIAKYLKPSTKGADRSPFSSKNLPKGKYEIPMEDLALYKEITDSIPKGNIRIYSTINDGFLNTLTSKKVSLDDIKADMKLKGLKAKEYFHSIGVWNNYIEYFKKNADM